MNTKEQFLSLLRVGLWGGEANPENFPKESTDWKVIYKLAEQQTVVGIVYDGLSTLPLELQPEQGFLRKWYFHVIKIENSHKVLNKTLVEIFSLYEDAGFTPILLKGQGIAQCYRNPSHRNCGDIDVFVGEKDYERSKTLLIEKKGFSKKDFHERGKHFDFTYNDVSIENHRIISQVIHQFSSKPFSSKVQEWYPHSPREIIFENRSILLPPVWFDVFYILLHASEHFFIGGIGLRQISDWCLLLHLHKKEIDTNLLKNNLRSLQLERIWGAFASVAVLHLGLPKDDMPFYDTKYDSLGEKLLTQIFREGNFGHHSKRIYPKGYWKGKLHSLWYILKRFTMVASIFPKETLLTIPVFVYTGIKQVIKDKL